MANSSKISNSNTTRNRNFSGLNCVSLTLGIVAIAFLVTQLNMLAYPTHEFDKTKLAAARKNAGNLQDLEKIGLGKLIGAKDIAYEPKSGVVYTGCLDGWIKRVKITGSVVDSVVENWIQTGGRPLGIVVADSGDVFVADGYKGLLKISTDEKLELMTDEAEGVKLGFPNGLAIAKNGMVYFTDVSSKCGYEDSIYAIWDSPHGRLLSYDPSTKQTEVLARDLHFPNGVEVSANQEFVIFCEVFKFRCLRYYIQGERNGSIDVFADNLPGFLSDNIRYDGDGHYLLAMAWGNSLLTKFIQPYPFLRKILAFTQNYLNKANDILKGSGVIVLDLEGKVVGGYYDEEWLVTTSCVKIGEHLYMGSFTKSYILRLNQTRNPFTFTIS